MNIAFKNSLSAPRLIQKVFKKFSKIPDPRKFNEPPSIKFRCHLMSGLAIFGLKFPSLLDYDKNRKDPEIEYNLKNLYNVDDPPSDTYMRERLDELDPIHLRTAFTGLFSLLQRQKTLEKFAFMDNYYLLSIDGTGKTYSGKISCPRCCKKQHKNGSESYYHQMLGACIVHPDLSNVIPLCPEMIENEDGNTKNDCERNASKRFIENFRREHPHLKVIVVEDGLASNGPHLNLLKNNNIRFIIGAKPGDHKFLFKELDSNKRAEYFDFTSENGVLHQFRFMNSVSLNKSHPDLKINFLEYRQNNPDGKVLDFSWVTDVEITKDNALEITRGGRSRWKIENETYNTLKNLGYNFEHSYGHGKNHLTAVFTILMMLSFFIDQIQELSCNLFISVKKKVGSYKRVWEKMRVLFEYVRLSSWEELYNRILKKHIPEKKVTDPPQNTS